jgi:hypothetical protein
VTVETALGALLVPGSAKVGRSVTLSIRPEHIGVGPSPAGALPLSPATLGETVFQGTHLRVRARTEAGLELLLRLPAGAEVTPGTGTTLHVDPARIVLLLP